MNLDDLLARIKKEADRLQREEGCESDDAWQRAIITVMRETAEQQVSPFQERLLKTLHTLSPRPESPPVTTSRLLMAVGGLSGRWQAWYHLSSLEAMGLVHRPRGPKSGWKVRLAA